MNVTFEICALSERVQDVDDAVIARLFLGLEGDQHLAAAIGRVLRRLSRAQESRGSFLSVGMSNSSSFIVTMSSSPTTMVISSGGTVLIRRLGRRLVPGRAVFSSCSTLTAPAMTMKKSMITKTTSIIGAI